LSLVIQFIAFLGTGKPKKATVPASNGKLDRTKALKKLQYQTYWMQCILWVWVLGIDLDRAQSNSFPREVMVVLSSSHLFSFTLHAMPPPPPISAQERIPLNLWGQKHSLFVFLDNIDWLFLCFIGKCMKNIGCLEV